MTMKTANNRTANHNLTFLWAMMAMIVLMALSYATYRPQPLERMNAANVTVKTDSTTVNGPYTRGKKGKF